MGSCRACTLRSAARLVLRLCACALAAGAGSAVGKGKERKGKEGRVSQRRGTRAVDASSLGPGPACDPRRMGDRGRLPGCLEPGILAGEVGRRSWSRRSSTELPQLLTRAHSGPGDPPPLSTRGPLNTRVHRAHDGWAECGAYTQWVLSTLNSSRVHFVPSVFHRNPSRARACTGLEDAVRVK